MTTISETTPASTNTSTSNSIKKADIRRSSTYDNQSSLPRLPIPPLAKTLERFAQTITPLLPSATDRAETARIINNFQSTPDQGPKLQSLLLEYDAQNKYGSYIEEFWSEAYLAPDTSVVLNLNPYFLLEEGPDSKTARDQILQASSLTYHTLRFAALLRDAGVMPDIVKGQPLCMDQFKALFGSCRIPKVGTMDVVEVDPNSSHVVVLFRNQFYYFQGLWPSKSSGGDEEEEPTTVAVSEADIAQILRSIVKDGKQTSAQDSSSSAVGVLTTLPRRKWAKIRETMIQTSERNRTALDVIDSGLFVLVLDEFVPENIHEAAANMLHGTNRLLPKKNNSNKEIDTNGGGMNDNGDSDDEVEILDTAEQEFQAGTCTNRWYDKMQIIVCSDGSAGINFEHSAIDGHTALRFISDVFAETVVSFAKTITKSIYQLDCPIPSVMNVRTKRAALEIDSISGKQTLDTRPKKLTFDIEGIIGDRIYFAETALGDAVSADDTFVLEFKNFGKNFFVSNNLSPDSTVQMSILLAYYRLYGEIVCTYEPVLTKGFSHGRTEAMRSATDKAAAFCKCWTSKFSSKEEKIEALREATKFHSKSVREAAQGQAVDRHLYALYCIAEKHDLPIPEFFHSKAWKTLNHTVLSTSNCGNPSLRLFGFGPVVPDGFGIGYIIKDYGLQYSISSKHRQTRRYANTLLHTLLEMEQMLKPITSLSVEQSHKESKQEEYKKESLSYRQTNALEYVDGFDTYGESETAFTVNVPKRDNNSSFYVGRTLQKRNSFDISQLSLSSLKNDTDSTSRNDSGEL